MIIHNPILTGSFTVNGTDVSSITSSAASLTSLNAYTASQNNRNGTYATTGSNTFAGIQTVNSNLVVTGSITAQTLVVQTVTSSVVYSSGSNVFGNNIANTQVMTGSVLITGSVGIGTNSPLALLHLSSSTSTAAYIHSTGTANYASLNLTNKTTGYGYDVGFGGSTSIAPNCFYIYGGATASVKLAVASNGNIGIGTVYPSASLEVSGSVYVGGNTSNSNYKFFVKRGTDRNMGIGLQGTDLSVEFVNDAFSANVPTRIYANPLVLLGGQVLIGTATAIFNSQVNINYNQSTYEGLAISTDKAYNSSPQPNLIFGGKYNSSGDYRQYATIQSFKDNTTDGNSAASLVFYTNGNSASITERMRIASNGTVTFNNDTSLQGNNYINTAKMIQWEGGSYWSFRVISSAATFQLYQGSTGDTPITVTSVGSVSIGTATNFSDVRLQVAASGGVGSWISGTFAGTGDGDKVVIGNYTGKGPSIGGHNSTLSGWSTLTFNFGGGAVYAGTLRIDNNSDQRVKRNITSVENALDTILKLQGRKFNMIDEDNILRYGFVAQEVQPHLSDFVTESIREHKDENVHITNLLTLETSGAAWAALLVEAIKELKAEFDEYKTTHP